jgi:hypothetical protein
MTKRPLANDSTRGSSGGRRRAVVAAMLATFVGFRVVLHFRPDTDLVVAGYDVHHLYTGVLVMAFFGIPAVLADSHRPVSRLSAAGFGVGTAMALDQWVYLITTDGTNTAYVTQWSLWTGAVMVLLGVAYALIAGSSERQP